MVNTICVNKEHWAKYYPRDGLEFHGDLKIKAFAEQSIFGDRFAYLEKYQNIGIAHINTK